MLARIHVLHPRNDVNVHFRLGEAVYEGLEREMVGDEGVVSVHQRRSVEKEKGVLREEGVRSVTRGAFAYRRVEHNTRYGGRVAELEVLRFGGHNEVAGWENVGLAVRRAIIEIKGWRRPGLDTE